MSRAILLDIEGTIGSISYVKDVMFPYASARIPSFVDAGHPRLPALLDAVRAVAEEPDADQDRCVAILLAWSAEDRKVGPLKELQGLIWEAGFRSGALRGHLYDDAAEAIARWADSGRTVAIYSSGSAHAQRLYLGHSDHGDLRRHIRGWFDTTVGPKRAAASYTAIAAALGRGPGDVAFFSDVVEELDAAGEAGLATWLVDRERPPTPCPHRSIASFAALEP